MLSGWLREDTNSQTVMFGPLVDKTDGYTAETGLATAMGTSGTGIQLYVNGSFLGDRSSAGAIVHEADGIYIIPLDATDTATPGVLTIRFNDAACRIHREDYLIVDNSTWLAFVDGSSGSIRANAVSITGTDLITSTTLAASAANEIRDAIFANTYEGTETFNQFLRLARAVLFGESTSTEGTRSYKSANGSTTRVVCNVDDGDRSTITTDPS